MQSFVNGILGIFGKPSTPAAAKPIAAGEIAAHLALSKISVSYPPPNGDAGMWHYEVNAEREAAGVYTVTIKQLGKRDKATYRLPEFMPDSVLDVIRHHIASQPMPAAKGKSRKPKEPAINSVDAVYHVTLPGADSQGRPRACEVSMVNSPLCLGHEGPERPSQSGEFQKTWNEKFIHDPRPCHASVCRMIDGRRGSRTVAIATDGYGLADAIQAASAAGGQLDWR